MSCLRLALPLPAAEKAAKQARKERLLQKQGVGQAAMFGGGNLLAAQLQQQLLGLVRAARAPVQSRPCSVPLLLCCCASAGMPWRSRLAPPIHLAPSHPPRRRRRWAAAGAPCQAMAL